MISGEGESSPEESSLLGGGDDLPEYEPLSPELLEDEAIRGDFVLRAVLVALGLLFACVPIADSQTLMHIRSGEQLASRGFWPRGVEPFSYTAGDRRWVNLSWGFDLTIHALHQLGGGVALSLTTGLLGAAIFWSLDRVRWRGVRTWWSTACGLLALLAVSPALFAAPRIAGPLFLAAMFAVLVRYWENDDHRALPWLVPLFWAWSQFDSRAWFGLAILACLGVGQRPRSSVDGSSKPTGSRFAVMIVLAAGAMLLHPFGYETWLSPWRIYAQEYPALRQAFPQPGPLDAGALSIWDPTVWRTWRFDLIAGLALGAVAPLLMGLNGRRVPVGHWLAWLFANGLGCWAIHEAPLAAIVNAALAGLHGQEWYFDRFGQVYSTAWLEVLWSRGGRALTLLAQFALALAAVSGRLEGPDGRRTGVGFHPDLAAQMSGYEAACANSFDDRPFSFAIRQGDLLIWARQRVFVDRRVAIYQGRGEADLLELHDRVRRALRSSRSEAEGSGNQSVWIDVFNRYGVTHVMPRLYGYSPPADYITLFDLHANPLWAAVYWGGPTAVLYRTNVADDPAYAQFLKAHEWRWRDRLLSDSPPENVERRDWPQPPNITQRVLAPPRTTLPNETWASQHLVQAVASGTLRFSDQLAAANLAVRDALAGVRAGPHSPDGRRALGDAYLILSQVEQGMLRQSGVATVDPLRDAQIINAYEQAKVLNPDSISVRAALLSEYRRLQRWDLALDEAAALDRLTPLANEADDEEAVDRRARLATIRSQLEDQVERVLSRLDQAPTGDAPGAVDVFSRANFAAQSGCWKEAMRLLSDAGPPYLSTQPAAQLALAVWKLESGQGAEADTLLARLRELASGAGHLPWRDSAAACAVVAGDQFEAIRLWEDEYRELDRLRLTSMLSTLPFTRLPAPVPPEADYPIAHSLAAYDLAMRHRAELANLAMKLGRVNLEIGRNSDAIRWFRNVVDRHPESPWRPLVRQYLMQLTDETIDLEPPSDWIPSDDVFTPDAEADTP